MRQKRFTRGLSRGIAVVVCLVVGTIAYGDERIRPHGSHAAIREIDVDNVRWTQGFWADRFTQAREVTIPTMWKYFQGETRSTGIDRDEASFVWDNFLIAAGRKQGQYRPVPGSKWGDGDFYKWLEAVAAVYWITHDQELTI